MLSGETIVVFAGSSMVGDVSDTAPVHHGSIRWIGSQARMGIGTSDRRAMRSSGTAISPFFHQLYPSGSRVEGQTAELASCSMTSIRALDKLGGILFLDGVLVVSTENLLFLLHLDVRYSS